jgi:hypothetical protein
LRVILFSDLCNSEKTKLFSLSLIHVSTFAFIDGMKTITVLY